MHSIHILVTVIVAIADAIPSLQTVKDDEIHRPSADVYECPQITTISFSKTVPDQAPFPYTEIRLCYDQTPGSLHINFTAHEEKYFFYNENMTINDLIFLYEVMGTFISKGVEDPQTYLEFEVNPNNATWQSIYVQPVKETVTVLLLHRLYD